MRNVCFKTATETACAPWGRPAAAFPLAGPPPSTQTCSLGEPRALGGVRDGLKAGAGPAHRKLGLLLACVLARRDSFESSVP